ncbi:MAG TPA: DUF222 domain-containing protein [Candidatus Dormibacteraeota bacterium]
MPTGAPVLDIGLEFQALRGAVACFAARVERDFSAAEIGEQVIHLSQTRDIISRELAKLTAVFSATNEAHIQGSDSPADWVRHRGRMSVADVLALQVVGEQVGRMPLSSSALDQGRIGFGHLVHLARNAAFAEKSRTGVFDEVPLLVLAEEESVSRFRHTCLNARHAQDPDGCAAAEVSAVESRTLSIEALDDGTTWFNVRLDAAAAAITQSVLESRARRLGPDDHRTRWRRMADAFVEVTHAPVTELAGGEAVGKNVHINVTCTAGTLLNLPGSPGGEIEFGQPISAAAINRLACNATFTKILLDDKLIPVAVGHMKRVLTRRERRALNARDGHCRYPGCDRQPSQCEAHHVEWYSRGGKTRLSNMLLLCAMHHWRVHEGGWLLALAPGDSVVVVPPQFSMLARAPGVGVPV